ncbi:hypothetical protein B0T14DRAFT_520811 [Immersiella caudata]|uniref:Uncharacterized protein n=1 Tax=Immersiella caudata TaxID=314043 RepID=A0AA39WRF0_9PEZI|nr:hypothetical protein B0T14DRAFT_520811 [Immersiella caudata]
MPLDGTTCNSYLLGFFKHGEVIFITRDNGIKSGDMWFRLKDFSLVLSLVLATVVTSLAGVPASRRRGGEIRGWRKGRKRCTWRRGF